MTIRAYGLAGLGVVCIAGGILAQGPRADNLPPPGLATPNFSQDVPKPPNVELKVTPCFTFILFAYNCPCVRLMQWSQNGDLFVSQYNRNTITVLRDTDGDGKPDFHAVYAAGSIENRRDPAGERGGARRGPGGPPPPQ